MLCVAYDATTGVVSVVTPTPSDLNTCQAVLSTYSELSGNPFALSLADGQQIGLSIALLLATAFTFRVIIRGFFSNHEESEGES